MKKIIILIVLIISAYYLYDKYKPFSSNISSTDKIQQKKENIDSINSTKPIEPTKLIEPTTDKEYFARGNIKSKNNNYKAAILDYNKAINLNPDYVDAFEARALMKDKINDFIGSRQDYDTAIKIKSNANQKRTQTAYKNLKKQIEKGNQKVLLKDYDNAIKDYTEAADLYPQYPDAYICRGDVRYILKDYHGALSDYNKAIRMSSNFELYYKRGNIKFSLNDYKNAVEDYKISISLNTSYEKSYYKLVGALIFYEKFEEALNILQKFMTIVPNPYIYASDFHSWNSILNKYHQDPVIRDIKNNIKKLKVIA